MSKLSQLKTLLIKHRKALVITAVLLVLGGAGWYWFGPVSADDTARLGRETTTQPEQPLTKPGLLSGEEVEPSIANRPVTGVMIENSPDARPQSGLDAAGIVFEAVAEGGITRFLALYQENSPDPVGPVRSLRPYYLDWAMGFDAAIAHVGGSGRALSLVQSRSAKDLDQFRYAGPYYRTADRFAPHNVYSSIKALRGLQIELGYKTSSFKPLPRADDQPAETPRPTRIAIGFSGPLYMTEWRYQKDANNYRRFMAGAEHSDRESGKAITTDNLVVLKMPTGYDGSYAVMPTIGSGSATIFKNGSAQKATWRQQSFRERIELINAKGRQVPLNRGQTWFAVQPIGQPLSY